MSFALTQKAVRVTTLMKRLRASEQGESGASAPAAGAAADPNPASVAPVPDAGGASTNAGLAEKASDTQTAVISAPSLPSAARQEEQPQARCNGDVPQLLPQRQGD